MSFIQKIIHYFSGTPEQRVYQKYQPTVDKINTLEPQVQALTDDELKQKTAFFKLCITEGKSLDDLLPEAFSVVREASKRVLGMRHFDVQLIGGIVLHEGCISQMRTGEGKTLVATLPAYLNALEGKGVYIVTVNDYLAKRDSEWMGQLFNFLGLSTGLIQNGMQSPERIKAYTADITYGTNNEFGFDYLRDNLVWDYAECCQVRRHFAIIDEVDSILIDEARTPLIISGPVKESTEKYASIAKKIRKLKKEEDFTLDEKHKNIVLTDAGISEIEKLMGIQDIYSVENMDTAHMVVQCLKALYLYRKDIEYVVKDGEVFIVDEFTGRILQGRRYSDGLHQAIEAIEGLKVQNENQTLASVTLQNYFRMFPKLAGMTGTADTEAVEFSSIYGLKIVSIPTHRPMIRKDMPDVVYKTKEEKYKAVIAEIEESYAKKQPILVGTISIETSEYLASKLKTKNIPCHVLNAKYHAQEAEIISRAGQKGGVTIATNMAGRGTDIVLEEGVSDLGGLYVLGTERHESRRIDNQLRGRSGRQGDPGKSRFFVSLEDDLLRLFGSERISKIMTTLGLPDDTPIEHPLISRSIQKAQTKVERYYFSIRKQVLQYDDVMNKQRETVYRIRHQILASPDMDGLIRELLRDVLKGIKGITVWENKALKNIEEIENRLGEIFPIDNFKNALSEINQPTDFENNLIPILFDLYLSKKNAYPEKLFEEAVTRRILLSTLDRHWMEHLHEMDLLRDGIGLRAWGQKDPLLEYKKEAFHMFSNLLFLISEESFKYIFRAVITISEEPIPTKH